MTFSELLDRFQNVNALVIGDLMLDEYIIGQATRISPEAPVMVIKHQRTEHKPGGAANVALNLQALGAKAIVVGVVGPDSQDLRTTFQQGGLSHVDVVEHPDVITTRKTRVLAGRAHQVIRVDYEQPIPSEDLFGPLVECVKRHLDHIQIIVFSDYFKGTLSQKIVSEIQTLVADRDILMVANPKPGSVDWYEGIDLISLNKSEAEAVLGYPLNTVSTPKGAVELVNRLSSSVLITLGESGMIASDGHQVLTIDAVPVEVADVAGAGDTVIATVALGMVANGFSKEIFALAASTAASVVQHVGVSTPSKKDLEKVASGT